MKIKIKHGGMFFCLMVGSLFARAQTWVQWPVSHGGNGHWYAAVLYTNGLTWNQAADLARNQGAYLATITSTEENTFVYSLVDTPKFFSGPGGNGAGPVIGGFATNGVWGWVTGETWNYTSWSPGQPDYAWEDRLQYWSGTQGVASPVWNNVAENDSNSSGYVMERNTKPMTTRSGIYGQTFLGAEGGTLLFPAQGTPTKANLSVYKANGKLVSREASNPVGQFYQYLQAGDYIVVGSLPKSPLPPDSLTQNFLNTNAVDVVANIKVMTNTLTPMEIDF